jgi:hypothetical protein
MTLRDEAADLVGPLSSVFSLTCAQNRWELWHKIHIYAPGMTGIDTEKGMAISGSSVLHHYMPCPPVSHGFLHSHNFYMATSGGVLGGALVAPQDQIPYGDLGIRI